MATIEQSIDVRVPVRTAYNQWTQFESFPYFMDGVQRVIQVNDTLTHWETKVGGIQREFDARITEQHPDEKIAWRTTEGPDHGGTVTFHPLDEGTTRVSLTMEYDPETLTEKVGTALGVVSNRISGDLQRFKEFIEDEGHETGAWRGVVTGAHQDARFRQPQRSDDVATTPFPRQADPHLSSTPAYPDPGAGAMGSPVPPPINEP
ncbi:MAG: SRPBCC family protein [Kutzneria sp.]|nr:SRPBCC family protein [Kutzneria sp.]